MMFVSEPPPEGDAGGPIIAAAERAACVRAACDYLLKIKPKGVRIAQSLPEPEHPWAIDACLAASFLGVGTLSYMRRALSGSWPAEVPDFGPQAELITFAQLRDQYGPAHADAVFMSALDQSYVDTLDCPELCGLRATADVLESHRTTGKFDPRLWWLIRGADGPLGCLLLNPCPEQSTVELVYIGLSKAGRGSGWGKKLLTFGVSVAARMNPTFDIACAVDERNVPARKLYESMGFRSWSRRVALVRPL
jgi:GNAT superfamily N-acetyltransferase